MNKFFGVLALLLSLGFHLSVGQIQGVSQQQAVHLAEVFIQENGYTSKPASPSALRYELFDAYEKNVRPILKARGSSLHPRAFCILEDTDSWHVEFLSTQVNVTTFSASQKQADLTGRAVVVNKRNKEVKMVHKDPLFARFKKL
jgi:hypothetical protein